MANKSATSWKQVVVMEFGKPHDTTDFCPHQLVANLLWTCYGETSVMNFGLNVGYLRPGRTPILAAILPPPSGEMSDVRQGGFASSAPLDMPLMLLLLTYLHLTF